MEQYLLNFGQRHSDTLAFCTNYATSRRKRDVLQGGYAREPCPRLLTGYDKQTACHRFMSSYKLLTEYHLAQSVTR